MKSPTRRIRRRRSTNDTNIFRQETAKESPFFSSATEHSFFPPAATIHRKCEDCEKEDKNVQRMEDKKEEKDKNIQRAAAEKEEEKDKTIQRAAAAPKEEEKDKMVQKKEGTGATTTAGASVSNYVSNLSGKGQPLPASANHFFSSRMGYDFTNVRLHTDKAADESAKDVNAKAYTIDNHIVFSGGNYQPETSEGKRLLAHELTHVMQQGDAKGIQRKPLTAEEKAEDLQSDRLKGDPRLQKAFDNSPWIAGEISEGVKTLQRALRDLGYDLPKSFKKGDADGDYGKETKAVIKQFQTDTKLEGIDGITGRETLKAMDDIFSRPIVPCNVKYLPGKLGPAQREGFLKKRFSEAERPMARKVLEDLCATQTDQLVFGTEDELYAEVFKRSRISQLMQASQGTNAFDYPESSKGCPGSQGRALQDAKVNLAAKDYWKGPILETRAIVKNRHYFFELTPTGKDNAYEAIRLLFTPQQSICDRTLIHCDSLVSLIQTMTYAELIGVKVFNQKVKTGQLNVFLTYDGMSPVEGDTTPTAASLSTTWYQPASENDLVIGDFVVFWNHNAYDAMNVEGYPWRLESAILVDKDSAGGDLYEGHGVATRPKKEIHKELADNYNYYVKQALVLTNRIDKKDKKAEKELKDKFPQVKRRLDNTWFIKQLDEHKNRPKEYVLKEITNPLDPEIIGLRNPDDPAKMYPVRRPVESLP